MHIFYLEPHLWQSEPVLEGQEARHLIKVLRLRPGDELTLLDGAGREARCRLSRCDKRTAWLEIIEETRHPRQERRVILAAGWGKAARRGWILEKAVELEAAALWFWPSARSQFPLPDDIKDNWQAQLVAGAKQCRNPWLPELRMLPGGMEELVSASADFEHKQLLVEADHLADGFLDETCLGTPGTTLCVVGPEGGFTSKEVAGFREAGFRALTMGTRVLRWETAAIMVLGLHWWARQKEEANGI